MTRIQERIMRYIEQSQDNGKPVKPRVIADFVWHYDCTRAERRQTLDWIHDTYPTLYIGMQDAYPKIFLPLDVTMLYTTAPKSYDSFGAEELAVVGTLNGKPLRKIEIPTEHVGWQCGRNWSGLHPTYTEAEFLDLLDRPWHVALTEEPAHE